MSFNSFFPFGVLTESLVAIKDADFIFRLNCGGLVSRTPVKGLHRDKVAALLSARSCDLFRSPLTSADSSGAVVVPST